MSKTVYYIPNGPMNLQPLFPALDFNSIEEYYVQTRDSSGTVIASANINQVSMDNEDFVRLHFLNRLGAIDSMLFELTEVTQEVKAAQAERPTRTPLVKSAHGVNRYNVASNDTLLLTCCDVQEEDMDFVEELFSSPLVWMQWKGKQGQPDDYIPVVLSDQKNTKRKNEDRYSYEVHVEAKLSHEKFNLRN